MSAQPQNLPVAKVGDVVRFPKEKLLHDTEFGHKRSMNIVSARIDAMEELPSCNEGGASAWQYRFASFPGYFLGERDIIQVVTE